MISGSNNPIVTISVNSLSIRWANKAKYLEVYLLYNTGKTDLTNTIKKFCSQFNIIMSVL